MDLWAAQEGGGRGDEAEAEVALEEGKPEGAEGPQVFLEGMQMGRIRVTMGCTMDTLREQC